MMGEERGVGRGGRRGWGGEGGEVKREGKEEGVGQVD